MPTLLSVNVNKVATLRNQRDGDVPSVLGMAKLAMDAGAHGITVHPRPDARHIRASDCDDLAAAFAAPEKGVGSLFLGGDAANTGGDDRKRLPTPFSFRGEFNIEGNPLDFGGGHLMPILRRIRPTQATLVPDDPGQNTSDHGWDVVKHRETLKPIVAELKALGCRVSLFLDPDPELAKRAADTGCDRIELYTEGFAKAFAQGGDALKRSLDAFAATAQAARAAGLGVNAGHDLNLENLPAFLAAVPCVDEVSIGHALVADALVMGMSAAVAAYVDICQSAG
ncbi:MAG: pyridoxine 5'-phosphate synthase [Planctomycetota bacterium]